MGQMLEQQDAKFPSVWQQIGVKDPHAAANSLFQQNDNFGYKAPTQKLFALQRKKMNARRAQARPNVWSSIGAPNPAAATKALFKQNDNYGYKARPQMLAEMKAPSTVWQQIGADDPKVAAQQLMKQNDNFGYKAPTQSTWDIGIWHSALYIVSQSA